LYLERNPLYPAGGIGIWSVGFCGGRKTESMGSKAEQRKHMVLDWNQTSWAALVEVLSPLHHSHSPKLNYQFT